MAEGHIANKVRNPMAALEQECFLRAGQIASLTGDLYGLAAFLRDRGLDEAAALTECLASQHGLPALKRRSLEWV